MEEFTLIKVVPERAQLLEENATNVAKQVILELCVYLQLTLHKQEEDFQTHPNEEQEDV